MKEFNSAHSSSNDQSLEMIKDTNEEMKESKILSKVLEHLKPQDTAKEKEMNVEKIMTDYFTQSINSIFN